MDFFQAQEQARQRSHLLIAYFLLAVLGIILALYLAFSLGLALVLSETEGQRISNFDWFSPLRFLGVAVVTGAVIGLATFFKIVQLRQGGGVVARSVGGRKLHADTTDFKERQLLNVVEEMAIASGTPMPEVYILDNEDSINAFAAGFSPNDAAVAVTRGALDRLSRDELQGVMAHEFSHILNGDMRLNIKLAGVLFGILILAMTGRILLHSMRFTAISRGGGRGGRGGGGAAIILAIILTAVALLVIGYIGVLFGRLIQAGVSRQREFLADAAAVQFTRNPDGIAGALKKIGGLSAHSAIQSGQAMNVAHMCFGSIEKRRPAFFSLATHPPLEKRIKAIDPHFDGKFTATGERPPKTEKRTQAGMHLDPAAPPPLPASRNPQERFQIMAGGLAAAVGAVGLEQVQAARQQIAAIPEKIRQARHDTAAARAVILSLVFDRDPESLMKQMQTVEGKAAPEVAKVIQDVALEVRKIPPELRFTVLEMMIPALYTLPPADYERFSKVLEQCILSDDKVDFMEFIIQRLVRKQVEPRIFPDTVDRAEVRFHSLHPLKDALQLLLSFLASKASGEAATEFEKATRRFSQLQGLQLVPAGDITFAELDQAVDRMAHAAFPIRKRFLDTCSDLVLEDGKVSLEEAEWIRLLSLSLDCPLPPLTPNT